jgi:uncharacterized phiE125 gp8 family phage protein
MTFKRLTPAGTSPVTRDELKTWLKIDGTADDTLLDAVNLSAATWAEQFLGRTLLTGTWEYTAPAFPDGSNDWFELLHGPVQSVDSVTYRTLGGGTGTWAGTSYQLDTNKEPARLRPVPNGLWPDEDDDYFNAVTIRYTAGYGTAGNVPEGIKIGIKEAAAALNEHRGEGDVPKFAEVLLYPYRIMTLR